MNLSEIFHTKNGVSHFDMNNTLQFIQYKGKQFFGKHFRIYPNDYELIYKILVWVVQDQSNCKNNNISLQKGILLSGPVGSGKTSLMILMNYILGNERKYALKSAREISLEFSKYGYDTINKYGKYKRLKSALCLDDLGMEPRMKYFGADVNVVKEIILCRYELFMTRGILTHATTNLDANLLQELYGPQVRSRMREMFNLISFPVDTKDKRM